MAKESKLKPGQTFSFSSGSGKLSPFDGITSTEGSAEIEKTITEGEADAAATGVKPLDQTTESKPLEAKDSDFDIFSERGSLEETEEVDENYSDNQKVNKTTEEKANEEDEEESNKDDDSEEQEAEKGDDDGLNAYFYLASQLKADGELPEEFEINESVSAADVYENYKKSLREDIETEVTQKVYSELAKQGINELDLKYAKLIRSGVDINSLSDASRYENFSSLDLEKASDQEKIEVIQQMFSEKKISKRAVEKLIETAELDDDLDSLAEEAKAFFGEKRDYIIDAQEKAAQQQEEQKRALEQRNIKIVEDSLKKGKLLGEDIPDVKEFKKGISERNQSVEIAGQTYPASELELFLLDFQNNPEVKLWAFKKYKYRKTEEEYVKRKAEAEAEKKLLDGYKVAREKSRTKNPTANQVKKQLESNRIDKTGRTSGPTYFRM